MDDRTRSFPGQGRLGRRRPLIPNGVLGMLMFVAIEMMMFAGLISAFLITKSSAAGGIWPPPGQLRLPVEETAINTGALLLSGLVLFWAERSFRGAPRFASKPLLATILLGTFFVAFQGMEWVALIGQGLTIQSGTYGGFFYLIVGMHAVHAIVALWALIWAWTALKRDRLTRTAFWSVQVFWYFVVGLWPGLYVLVYL